MKIILIFSTVRQYAWAFKIYIKDSGLLHALLNIEEMDDLMGHPTLDESWESFVIENISSVLPRRTPLYFYRTAAGAEIDLILDFGTNKIGRAHV